MNKKLGCTLSSVTFDYVFTGCYSGQFLIQENAYELWFQIVFSLGREKVFINIIKEYKKIFSAVILGSI